MQISPTWDQETTINNKTIVTGIGDLRLDDVTLTAYGTSYNALVAPAAPEFTVKALLEFGNKVTEGRVVASVTVPWRKIVGLIQTEPATIYDIDGFKWEEIIAGAYEESRLFDEVILTPRSGDRGRDVIAIKRGQLSIRIVDQMKMRRPGSVVTAEEVRSMLGVVLSQRDVSKGLITTTSAFAPELLKDPDLAAHIPYRLELRAGPELLSWLSELSR